MEQSEFTNVALSSVGITSFDYNDGDNFGVCCLKEVTDKGEYIYEILDFEKNDDSINCKYGILVLDASFDLNNDVLFPDAECPFDHDILAYLVKNNKKILLDRARDLNVDVFGDIYRSVTSYKAGEPWAKINEAIAIEEVLLATNSIYANSVNYISENITLIARLSSSTLENTILNAAVKSRKK